MRLCRVTYPFFCEREALWTTTRYILVFLTSFLPTLNPPRPVATPPLEGNTPSAFKIPCSIFCGSSGKPLWLRLCRARPFVANEPIFGSWQVCRSCAVETRRCSNLLQVSRNKANAIKSPARIRVEMLKTFPHPMGAQSCVHNPFVFLTLHCFQHFNCRI